MGVFTNHKKSAIIKSEIVKKCAVREFPNLGNAVINGGKYDAQSCAVVVKGGEVTINDGKFGAWDEKGDVNCDGILSIADVVELQKWLLAIPDVMLANWKAGDMNPDGILNALDLCLMKRALIENV